MHLRCLAVCRYPLRFEWLRQGFKVDLAASDSPISSAPAPKVPCTEVEMVSAGMTLQVFGMILVRIYTIDGVAI